MCLPKVSVVIPVYNVEKYLDRCIDSVTNQTYADIEIILVDDGSTDGSRVICDKWAEKDSRIKVIHKANEGAGLARNTGLDASTGEYVFFIDSDDYIHPDTVKTCVSTARKDGSQLVLYARADIDKNGNISPKPILTEKYLYRNSEVIEELLKSLYTHSKGFGLGVCGKMFKSETIRKSGVKFYSEREVFSEDALFLTEFFAFVSSASIVPEHFYLCVQHDDSLSKKLNREYQAFNDVFLKKALEVCNKKGYSENVKNHLKARYQIYALGGMRQIIASDLPNKEKMAAIKSVFNNRLLHSTLTNEVLSLGTKASKLFWKLFKLNCFGLCYVLLKLKTGK